jgi:FAD/FMN-containing dehydrogenase
LSANIYFLDYYDSAGWLGPACVIAPKSVVETSYVIKALTQLSTKFAVRGAGHMPIPGAANINLSGVLLSTSGLTNLALAADKSTVTVGAGNSWVDVQKYLEPAGLVAVGGRVGAVGVPGYLLGGGISFHSNQYGFASANVVKFEVRFCNGAL